MTKRLNINVNDETAAALEQLANRRDTSLTEIIRRAVSVYKFVEEEVGENGKTLQLVDGRDRVTTIQMV